MKATIEKLNTKTINAQGEAYTKYGFKVKEWNKDVWLNVVDWDRLYDNKSLSQGDTVEVSKPEHNSQYDSWEARFEKPHMNENGTQGYAPDEQAVKYLEHRVIPGLERLYKEIQQVKAELGIATDIEQDDNYPNPKEGQSPDEIDAAFSEYAEESDEDEINW